MTYQLKWRWASKRHPLTIAAHCDAFGPVQLQPAGAAMAGLAHARLTELRDRASRRFDSWAFIRGFHTAVERRGDKVRVTARQWTGTWAATVSIEQRIKP